MRCLRAAAFLSVLLVGAFRVQAQKDTSARAGYDAASRRFTSLAKKGDIPGLVSMYTEDATFVDADGTTTHGRTAFEQYWRAALASMTIKDFSIETSDFRASGPYAYGAGTDRLVSVDKKTGKESTLVVQFLVVFKQQPGKGWLLQYGMEAPLPTAGEPRR